MNTETISRLGKTYGVSQAKLDNIIREVGEEKAEQVLQLMQQQNMSLDAAIAKIKNPPSQGQYDRAQQETQAGNQLLDSVQQHAIDILGGYELALQSLVEAGIPAVKAKVMQSAFSKPTASVAEQMKAYLMTNTVNDYCGYVLEPTKKVLSLTGAK
jgi:hypothetical protein